MKRGREERAFPVRFERRALEDGTPPVIAGHAAVFNSLSDEMWGFRERIKPGAFTKTLQEADVRALWNHDPNYVLGRNRAGTLALAEDLHGLVIEATPPETTWARDLMVTMERGDVDQMSFGFRTIRDQWLQEGNLQIRELLEVELFDVSVVTFPAYPMTDAHVRAELALASADPATIRAVIERLNAMLSAEPGEPAHSTREPRSAEWYRRWLDRQRLSMPA